MTHTRAHGQTYSYSFSKIFGLRRCRAPRPRRCSPSGALAEVAAHGPLPAAAPSPSAASECLATALSSVTCAAFVVDTAGRAGFALPMAATCALPVPGTDSDAAAASKGVRPCAYVGVYAAAYGAPGKAAVLGGRPRLRNGFGSTSDREESRGRPRLRGGGAASSSAPGRPVCSMRSCSGVPSVASLLAVGLGESGPVPPKSCKSPRTVVAA